MNSVCSPVDFVVASLCEAAPAVIWSLFGGCCVNRCSDHCPESTWSLFPAHLFSRGDQMCGEASDFPQQCSKYSHTHELNILTTWNWFIDETNLFRWLTLLISTQNDTQKMNTAGTVMSIPSTKHLCTFLPISMLPPIPMRLLAMVKKIRDQKINPLAEIKWKYHKIPDEQHYQKSSII